MPLITTEYDPKVCQCCGVASSVDCVCTAFPDWHMTENGDIACGYHKAELYVKTERTILTNAPKPVQHDQFRNFRNDRA